MRDTLTCSVLFAVSSSLTNTPCCFDRGLVYPIPEVGGLGVHSTVDMEGNVRFGPDVEWVNEIDYVVRSSWVDQ